MFKSKRLSYIRLHPRSWNKRIVFILRSGAASTHLFLRESVFTVFHVNTVEVKSLAFSNHFSVYYYYHLPIIIVLVNDSWYLIVLIRFLTFPVLIKKKCLGTLGINTFVNNSF